VFKEKLTNIYADVQTTTVTPFIYLRESKKIYIDVQVITVTPPTLLFCLRESKQILC
jgi:hypothetical protein